MRNSESTIGSRFMQLKVKMESQFTGNTKGGFLQELENLFSKLDRMIEAIKSEPEENRSWVSKTVESKSSYNKFKDVVGKAGASAVRFGKAVFDTETSAVETGVNAVKEVAEFVEDGVKKVKNFFSSFF